MDARRKPNNFNTGPLSPGKPQVDSETRVALSQVHATCLAYNLWEVTAGQVSKYLKRTLGNLVSSSDITSGLDVACVAGYLTKVDGAYQFTKDGIDIVGETRSDSGRFRTWQIKRIRYRNR